VFGTIAKRLATEEEGFTLLELLISMEIIVILVALAGPSYLQFRDSADKATAKSNAKEVSVAAGLYFTSKSTYASMTIPLLKVYDASLTTTGTFVNNSGTDATGVTSRVTMDASHYCTYAKSGRWYVYQKGPNASFIATATASAVCS
jgi:prepilin-type N-terminal cleavage/methylation domain-containing protein